MNACRDLQPGIVFSGGASVIASTANMVGNIGAYIHMLSGYVGTSTIVLETAEADPIDPCLPNNATWTPIQNGGPCVVSAPNSTVIADTDEPFATDGNAICAACIICYGAFIRASVVGATANLHINLIAKAARTA